VTSRPPDLAALREAVGIRVETRSVVDSTMSEAAGDPGPRPVLHLAERQRAGRGRRGRSWSSPPGNLYATIVWPDEGGALSSTVLGAVQIAWAEAVARAGGPRCRVKWPNDGILSGRKWAGLMAERGPGPEGSEVRLGMGANLAVAPEIENGSALPATCLADHWPGGPEPTEMARILLDAALTVLGEGARGVGARLARWSRHDALDRNARLVVRHGGGEVEGRYGGVDGDGRLRLETPDGARRLAAGEVVRLRAASGPPAAP